MLFNTYALLLQYHFIYSSFINATIYILLFIDYTFFDQQFILRTFETNH